MINVKCQYSFCLKNNSQFCWSIDLLSVFLSKTPQENFAIFIGKDYLYEKTPRKEGLKLCPEQDSNLHILANAAT